MSTSEKLMMALSGVLSSWGLHVAQKFGLYAACVLELERNLSTYQCAGTTNSFCGGATRATRTREPALEAVRPSCGSKREHCTRCSWPHNGRRAPVGAERIAGPRERRAKGVEVRSDL